MTTLEFKSKSGMAFVAEVSEPEKLAPHLLTEAGAPCAKAIRTELTTITQGLAGSDRPVPGVHVFRKSRWVDPAARGKLDPTEDA
ncbi:MAG: hypothetical protein GY851_35735 [bacterium]|nr:hypothetical protein [bacterium]